MMKRILCVTLVVVFSVVLRAEAAQNRYKLKSGYIKYQLDGQNKGTEELYWDNFGQNEARYTNISMTVFGMAQTTNSIYIIDGDWAYSVDGQTNTATKINYTAMMTKMKGGDNTQKPMDFSEEMIQAFGGVKAGTEKILGKTATIYNLANMGDYRVWLWKGVPLKSEANFMGFAVNMVAVEFKENVRVAQAKLTLPPGVTVVDKQDVADMPDAEQMQQAMETLNQMQNSPEYQEAMQLMQEMQNNPEMQDALQEIQAMSNSPEMQEAMQELKAAQAGNKGSALSSDTSGNVAEAAGNIVQEEAAGVAEEALREETRKGMKKAVGGLLKSLF